ncbi:MAG: DUF5011 domain-containing protein [Bacteroidia bacterium]|nr:DUF5011 domain-containing protein [Bacteroidia bacterium]
MKNRIHQKMLVKATLIFLLMFGALFVNAQVGSRVFLIPPCRVWLDLNTSFLEPGYSAFDSNQVNITGSVIVNGNLDTSKVGRYILNYCIIDSGKPPVCAYRSVWVGKSTWRASVDTAINVKITIGTNLDTLTKIKNYLSENYLVNASLELGNIQTNVLGNYIGEIEVNDSMCGLFLIKLNVHVIDDVAPNISLLGYDTICLKTGTEFIDPGVLVSDNYYPAAEVAVTTSGSVNINVPGFYLIVYRATDPSGNYSETWRVVEVGDCELTGIERVEKENILCFPQPSEDYLNVQHQGVLDKNITWVRFINVLGVSYDLPIHKIEENSFELDLKQLPSGVYFLMLGKEGFMKTQKIVVRK